MTAPLERPRTFARYIRDLVLDRGNARILKAAVGAGTTSDPTWGGALATLEGGSEFRALLQRILVLPQLGLLRGPFHTPFAVQTERPVGYRVTPAEWKPVTRLSFVSVNLDAIIIGAITVISKELAASSAPGSQDSILRQIASGIRSAANSALLDPSIPGSLTNGLTPITSSGLDDASLFGDLIGLLGIGDRVVLIASLPWAVRVTAALGSAAPLVKIVIAPEAADLIIAIDPTAAAAAWSDEIDFDVSESTTLQMKSDPATGPQDVVSMFQTDSVALRAEFFANWQRTRDAGVAVLEMMGS